MYEDFIRFNSPNKYSTILDVGVSDLHSGGANWLERNYPYKAKMHACGLGNAEGLRSAFPDISYRKIEPNAPLPFLDNEFQIATCNAVLEHVGSFKNQRKLVRELIRVARQIFVTVPNRFFPVEHHTAIPLLHFNQHTFRLACKLLGKEKWSDQSNMIFLSKRRFSCLFPEHAVVGYTGLMLGPFSSNIFAYYRRVSDVSTD
jgi:hypothetical protein